MTTFGLAVSSLRQRRLRTVTTLGTLALMFAMGVVAKSASDRMTQAVSGFGDARVMVSPSFGTLPYTAINKLRALPNLDPAPQYVTWGDVVDATETKNFWVWAVSAHYLDGYPPTLLRMPEETMARWKADRNGVVATRGVLKELGWRVGDDVQADTSFGKLSLRVSGVVDGSISDSAFIHYDYVTAVVGSPPPLGNITFARPAIDPGLLAQTISTELDEGTLHVMTLAERAFHEWAIVTAAIVPNILQMVSIFFFFTSLLVLASVLLISVRERYAELGALRAIGFRRSRLTWMIVLEEVLLCAAGAVLGAGIPFLLFHSQGLSLGGAVVANVTIDASAVALALAVAVAMGIAVALPIALAATRRRTIELLGSRG